MKQKHRERTTSIEKDVSEYLPEPKQKPEQEPPTFPYGSPNRGKGSANLSPSKSSGKKSRSKQKRRVLSSSHRESSAGSEEPALAEISLPAQRQDSNLVLSKSSTTSKTKTLTNPSEGGDADAGT